MNLKTLNLKQVLPTVLVFGLLGGGLLILLPVITTKGYWSILIWTLIPIMTLLALKENGTIEMNYLKAFIAGVLTFMLMSYLFYFYTMISGNPHNEITLWGHVWRFFAILGFATTSSAILGLFFRK